jgi:tellurite resistance protein TerC
VKLVLHALHENELTFINGGEPVDVPDISSLLSLAVIIVTLAVTAVASLLASRSMSEEEIEERTSTVRAPDESNATE